MEQVLAIESLHPVAISTMAFYNISVGKEMAAQTYIQKIRMQTILPGQLEAIF